MAKKINIGASIGLDGEKEFRRAITGINSDMRVLGSEMKLAKETFSENANSIEALTKTDKILNEQLDKQKEKVEALRLAMQNSIKVHGDNDTITDKWKTSLNNAEEKMAKLDRELKTNDKYMTEAKKSANGMATSIDKLGKEIKTTGDHTLKTGDVIKANLISGAVIGGVQALGSAISSVSREVIKLGTDAASYADNIMTMSQQTGVSTDKLQAYNYMAELTDTSMETMTKTMAKNIKSMTNAQNGSETFVNAYKSLNVQVEDSNGKLRDSEEVYWNLIDALGGVADETERDSLSMQIFGKSAQDLNPLILQGSAGVKALTDEAKSMGAVLSTDTLSSLGKTDDALQRMYQSIDIAKRKFGAEMAPEMARSAEVITAKLSDMDDELAGLANGALSKATDGLVWLIDNSDLVVAGLSGIGAAMITSAAAGVITEVAVGMKAFTVATEGAAVAQTAFNIAQKANLVGLAATAIIGLGTAMVVLASQQEDVTTELSKLKDTIKEVQEESKKLSTDIKASENGFKENTTEVETNYQAVKMLSDKLFDLADRETKTNSEKAQMIALVNQLNETMPELNLILDEQTGLLNLNRGAIDGVVQSMKEKALAQLYEDRYLEVAKEQITAKENLVKATLAQEEAQKKLAAAEIERERVSHFETDDSITSTDMKAYREFDKYEAEAKKADKAVENYNETIDECDKKFAALDETIGTATQTTEQQATITTEASATTTTALADMEKAYKTAKTTAVDSVKSQINIFDKFADSTKTTKTELLKNLESQAKGVSEWADNLKELSKKGINDGLLAELKEMGPSAAGEIALLNSMSEKEMKTYEGSWKKLGKATKSGAAVIVEDNKEAYLQAQADAAKAIDDQQKAAAIERNKTVAEEARVAGNKTKDEAVYVGGQIVDGWAVGAKSKAPELNKTFEDISEDVINAVKKNSQIQSPSKRWFNEVGVQEVVGWINGIKSRKENLKKTATEMSEIILSEAKTKLDNHKVYNEMSLSQEISYWDAIRKQLKKGTQARIDADKIYFESLKTKKDADKQAIADKKEADTKAMESWNDFMQKKADNAKETEEELTAIADEEAEKQAEIAEEAAEKQADILDKKLEAEKTYQENVKKVNEDLASDIESLNQKYEDSLNSRTEAITSSLGLFSFYKKTEDVAGIDLLDNLESQVSGIEDWTKSLDALKNRGIGDGLLTELQGMGIKSAAEVEAINSLTDEQLMQYVALWTDKNALARTQATSELEGMKTDTSTKIQELKEQAVSDIAGYTGAFTSSLSVLATDAETIGNNIGIGLATGINNQKSAVELAMQGLGGIGSIGRYGTEAIGSIKRYEGSLGGASSNFATLSGTNMISNNTTKNSNAVKVVINVREMTEDTMSMVVNRVNMEFGRRVS